MRTPSRIVLHLAALAAGASLGAACGSGLYDAKGVPVIGGGGDTCGPGIISCGGFCTTPSPSQCGATCADCTAVTPPANGVAACLGEGTAGTCGYTCTDGFLKCAAGCCGTTALAAGDRSTCALLENGEVACWGANESGQVGDGAPAPARPAPHLVPLPAGAVAVAAGTAHACAVLQGGAVWCWGANDAGQATGTPGATVLSPVAVAAVSGAVAVTTGAAHTCALLGSGVVTCWGSSADGKLGPTPSGATAISAGRNHTCALVGGPPGAVQCWGANALDQLGGTPSSPLAGIRHLSAAADQTCAATGTSNGAALDDALRCWGDSLGAGWLLASPQPTPAIPLQKAGQATIRHAVTLLASGAHHVCVNGELPGVIECLGLNDRGQLGGAAATGEKSSVTLPANPAAVAAGAAHTCAAVADGRIRCWGANDAGQLGNDTTTDPGTGILAIPVGR